MNVLWISVVPSFVIIFFISCTSDDSTEQEESIDENEIRVLHSGDRLGSQTVIFNEKAGYPQ